MEFTKSWFQERLNFECFVIWKKMVVDGLSFNNDLMDLLVLLVLGTNTEMVRTIIDNCISLTHFVWRLKKINIETFRQWICGQMIRSKGPDYDYYVIAVDDQGAKQTKKMLGVIVENEELKYKLGFQVIGTESPTYGWSMTSMKFSIKDQQNDKYRGHFSVTHGGSGGWWYNGCHEELMNGLYSATTFHGIKKETWLMI